MHSEPSHWQVDAPESLALDHAWDSRSFLVISVCVGRLGSLGAGAHI
jgi:hypothetical protein